MNRTTTSTRKLNWLFNPYQAVTGRGGQIDWSKVTSFYALGVFIVQLAAAAAKGAVALTVDALLYPVASGTVLDFGAVASVIVTLTANKAIGQTSLAVTALTGPVPNGTILDFGTGKQAKLTAAALSGATTVTVEALDTALVSGDAATYQGGRLLAEVTADAAAGDTSLTVAKLQYAIADDSQANADRTGTGDKRFIPAGTIMARTSADKLIPRHDASTETASEILASDAAENSKFAAKSGYGTYIEAQVFENLLPDADTTTLDIPAGYKTELAANSARINFSDWSDSRAVDA